MFCDKYKCNMSENTCLARQNLYKAYFEDLDPGCCQCTQGRALWKKSKKTRNKINPTTHTEIVEKICGRCREVKSSSEFYFDPRTKTKLSSWCKECKSAVSKLQRDKNNFYETS